MSQRIGIYGGTFDPVHLGHIHAAMTVYNSLSLDKLSLVPAHITVHRDQPHATSEQRLAMLNLACEGKSGLTIDTQEIKREQPSYSLHTVTDYRDRYPEACLFFVLGTDALAQFHTWYRWQEILDKVNLIVLARPGHPLQMDTTVEDHFKARFITDLAEFRLSQQGLVFVVNDAMLPISATGIRQRLQEGKEMKHYLAPKVYQYIQQHQLYAKDLLE